MKKVLFLLLSVLVFSACSDEIPEEKIPVKSGRTILAYLISNNKSGSLDRYLKQNLVDMYSGLSQTTDSCTLLVYYRPNMDSEGKNSDTDGLTGPTILKYESDGNGNINNRKCLQGSDLIPSNVIKEAFCSPYTDKNHNATDPATMSRVLGDMVKLSPSTNYGLIFGSHGTSWMQGNAISGRSFGDDAGYNIDIPDMAEVLKGIFSSRQLDFILFDACMMATAEVCYELKDVADYLIGAVVETHVYGHPYDVIMPKMYKENIPYNQICRDYTDNSKNLGVWGTCSAIDCGKIDDLAGWVEDNLEIYSEKLVSFNIDDVQQYGVGSFKNFSVDIVDFFKTVNDGVIPDGLQDVMNEVVIDKDGLFGPGYEVVGSLELDEERYCGLGMYIPFKIKKTEWNTYYRTLSWYKTVGWERFETILTQ